MSNGITVTRSYIAYAIQRAVGLSYLQSIEWIDTILDEISNALVSGEEVKLTHFGTFKPRKKKARIGRNPKTKVEAMISPRTVVSFYPSQKLKERINSLHSKKAKTETKEAVDA